MAIIYKKSVYSLMFLIKTVFCALENEFKMLPYLYRLGVSVGLSVAQPVICQAVTGGEILCM